MCDCVCASGHYKFNVCVLKLFTGRTFGIFIRIGHSWFLSDIFGSISISHFETVHRSLTHSWGYIFLYSKLNSDLVSLVQSVSILFRCHYIRFNSNQMDFRNKSSFKWFFYFFDADECFLLTSSTNRIKSQFHLLVE